MSNGNVKFDARMLDTDEIYAVLNELSARAGRICSCKANDPNNHGAGDALIFDSRAVSHHLSQAKVHFENLRKA